MRELSRESNAGVMEGNAELGALMSAHGELETRLESLDAHVYLTPEEQLERKQIQKQKLLLKDKIRALQAP